MTRSDIALFVSCVSLGVALATFGWRVVFDIWLDGSIVKVTLDLMTMTGRPGQLDEVYVVTATNRGRRPTTVTSLWLTFGRPRRGWHRTRRVMTRRLRKKLFSKGILMPTPKWSAYNTVLPMRLDVGEQAHVYYERDAVLGELREASYRWMHGAAGVTSGRVRDSRRLGPPDSPA